MDTARKTRDMDPKSPLGDRCIGWVLMRQGDFQGAAAAFRKSIVLDPGNAIDYGQLSYALSRLGRMDEAIAAVRKSIELNPRLAMAHANLGSYLLAKNKDLAPAAAAECRKAIELDPAVDCAHVTLALCLFEMGDAEGALTSVRKALKLVPDFAQPHCIQGLILTRLGRFAEAEAAFHRGAELYSPTAAMNSWTCESPLSYSHPDGVTESESS
jgi:Flp pilus assembly protein TadD